MARRVLFGLISLIAVALAGCRTDTDINRFDRTWETPLADTSCLEWADEMRGTERYAAAADLLLTARADLEGFPTDGQIAYFMSRITDACEESPEASVSDTAAAVFAEHSNSLGGP